MTENPEPIKPTVGRIVHFWNRAFVADLHGGVGAGPYAAIVSRVVTFGDDPEVFCDLTVFPPSQKPFEEGAVPFKEVDESEGDDSAPAACRRCYWPARI